MNEQNGELNPLVRAYWEKEPCGTPASVTGVHEAGSLEWYKKIEDYRYKLEPFIHAISQFTRHRGKRILEVGVGAGTDHLQWARAGLDCYGVDLTDAAIETTRNHLGHYGLSSNLQRVDAEHLPFQQNYFDLVYSWGVIHHSESPEQIITEIRRVLRPGGMFIGMMYGRNSPVVLKTWIRHALLRGRPWRSFRDVVWNHMESIGTKAYTTRELQLIFREFGNLRLMPIITPYDRKGWPKWLSRFFPDECGWFIAIHAIK